MKVKELEVIDKMKYYDAEGIGTFVMQFGKGMAERRNNKKYIHKKKIK